MPELLPGCAVTSLHIVEIWILNFLRLVLYCCITPPVLVTNFGETCWVKETQGLHGAHLQAEVSI